MKVKEVMTKDVICVDKDVDLKHVLDLMKKHEITKIPVVEDKKLIGMITDNRIAYIRLKFITHHQWWGKYISIKRGGMK